MDSVRRDGVKREFRHGTRGESARRCIGDIHPGVDIFGLTKGDFSMIDIIKHVVDQIGPCNIDIGTWTAAHADVKQAFELLGDDRLLKVRWLVDRSFPNRQPGYFARLRESFGDDAIRIARFHAKFLLAENDGMSVAVRTSMNLNKNERIEFYEISEGSPISDYLRQIVDYHFELPNEDSFGAFKGFKVDNPPKSEDKAQDVDFGRKLGGWD